MNKNSLTPPKELPSEIQTMHRRRRSCANQLQHQQCLFDIASLPLEILIEILIRLPSKTITCFKTVSKSWLSIITTTSFLRQHHHFLKSSHPYRDRFMYAFKSSDVYGCFSVEAFMLRDKQVIELDWDIVFSKSCIFDSLKFEYIDVSGPVDGIYCVGSIRGQKPTFKISCLELWNPTNRHVRVLPMMPHPPDIIRDLETGSLFKARIADYGFGYDSSTNDYKVVILMSCYDKSTNIHLLCGFQMYSLATNEWKQLDPFKVSIKDVGRHITDCSGGFYLNGACHWSNNCYDCRECRNKCIISFHFDDEVFRVYKMPKAVGDVIQVTSVNGCLAAVCVKKQFVSDIWTMKEYGVESSWSNVYNITNHEKIINSIFVVDEEVFAQTIEDQLISYSLHTPSEEHEYGNFGYLRHVLPYHESLVPLR